MPEERIPILHDLTGHTYMFEGRRYRVLRKDEDGKMKWWVTSDGMGVWKVDDRELRMRRFVE